MTYSWVKITLLSKATRMLCFFFSRMLMGEKPVSDWRKKKALKQPTTLRSNLDLLGVNLSLIFIFLRVYILS